MGTHAAAAHEDRVSLEELAANVRVISVDTDQLDGESVAEWRHRIDLIVRLFLEKRWKPPRKLSAVAPLSYVLIQGTDDSQFQHDVETLRWDLKSYLFGEGGFEGVKIECFVGPVDEIAALAQRAEEAFAAAKRAPAPGDAAGSRSADAAMRPRPSTDAAGWEGRLRLYAGYDAPKRAVVCYLAGLSSPPTASASASEAGAFDDYAGVLGSKLAGLEAAGLKFAASHIYRRSKLGAVCYCITPLRFETVKDRKKRDAYLDLARKIPEDVRRYVAPSIFGADPGTPSSLLMEIVGGLRTVFPFLDWRTTACAIDVDRKRQARLSSVTLVLPRAPNARSKELEAFPELARRLTAQRMRAGVAGVQSAAEMRALIAGGAHYLTGPAVSAPMQDLASRSGVEVEDLPLRG